MVLTCSPQTVSLLGRRKPAKAGVADQMYFPSDTPSKNIACDGGRAIVHNAILSIRPRGTFGRDAPFPAVGRGLTTPRPPELLVLNEPETSLHPDLLPALASLIGRACEHSQVWVVSHAEPLVAALKEHPACLPVQLEKELGETVIKGQGWLDRPPWHWLD